MVRRVVTAALLTLVLLLERFAYYGMRSLLFLYLRDSVDHAYAHFFTQAFTWAVIMTPFAGAVLCALVPPRFVVVVGALGAIAGYALLGLVPGRLVFLPLGVLALALGLFRPAIFVAAGELFARRENIRIAVIAVLYAAVNLGAMAAPPMFSRLRAAMGDENKAAFFLCAGLLVLVTILAGAAAVMPMLLRDDEPPPAPEPLQPAPILASIALVFAAIPTFAVTSLLSQWQYRDDAAPGWLFDLNPAVILTLAPLLAGVFVALSFTERRVPVAFPIAAGIALTALSAIPALFLAPSPVLIALTLAVGAVAEVLLATFALSRLVTGVHPRAQGAIMALWLSATFAAGSLAALLPARAEVIALAIMIFFCFGASAAVAASFQLLDRAFRVDEFSDQAGAFRRA